MSGDSPLAPDLRRSGPRVALNGLGIVIIGGLLWLLGVDLLHAFVLAAALAALNGLRHSPAVNLDQSWPTDMEMRADVGVRREVARLSWSMQGYEARVQRQSVRRLQAIASYRLGEQGLELDDPRDYLACQLALGERAYRVISEPDERPQYADFVAAVTAVEKIAAPRRTISGV